MRTFVGYIADMAITSQDLIILTSPPASGKTYWIKAYSEALTNCSILVISPLRALVEECRAFFPPHVQVMTPEAWIRKKVSADIIIFDEFHLWFYWGDTFRDQMWEAFYEITSASSLCVALTATLSEQMIDQIAKFSCGFDRISWIDCGNQRLRFKPVRYLKCPDREWLLTEIMTQGKSAGVKLIFCQYREEVLHLERKLRNEGYSCLSCIGGEARDMKGKLLRNSRPDYIIATTVLSHGVNLPEISKIFFLYPVKNPDFWIQMVARGGRSGSEYEVFSVEAPQGLEWNRVQNFFQLVKHTLIQKIKLNIGLLLKF